MDFVQAIAANLAATGNPDLIVMVNGTAIPADCILSWELVDDEKGMSTQTVEIANEDGRFTSLAAIDGEIACRFGYDTGELSPICRMKIGKIERNYVVKGGRRTVSIQGVDDMNKLAGGDNAGNLGEGSPRDLLEKTLKNYDVTMTGEGDGPKLKSGTFYNENALRFARRQLKQMRPKNAKGRKSKGPQPNFPNGPSKGPDGTDLDSDDGSLLSSASRIPEDGAGRDGNRAANQGDQAGSEPVQADLKLRWFPTLRAKGVVAIIDADPEDNGSYYSQKVTHSWRPGQGFQSLAHLTRGGIGQGGADDSAPMVMYAEIFEKHQVYVGPRKNDSEPQATFSCSDDPFLIEFKVVENPQRQRHGGEQGKGKAQGIDPWNKNEPYTEDVGAGDGGSDSGKDTETGGT